MDESFDQQVGEVLETVTDWATIEELVAVVSDRVEIPDEFKQSALKDRLAAFVRRKIKERRGSDGLAEFESIQRETDQGKERVYKRVELFSKEEFRLSSSYYAERSAYYGQKANTLITRCNAVHKTRYQLPLPQFGVLCGEEAATT